MNPVSGSRNRRARNLRLAQALDEQVAGLTVQRTSGPGDASRLAAQAAAAGAASVWVAGGDGTINEALQGLVGTSTTLVPLPAGTANVLCREIGLSMDPFAAIPRLLRGNTRPVTVGEVTWNRYMGGNTKRFFLLMAGAGLDAEICQSVPSGLKRYLGATAFMLTGAVCAVRYPYPGITLSTQTPPTGSVPATAPTPDAPLVIIANSRNYGGPFRLAPEAGLEQPGLCSVALSARGPVALLRLAWAVLRGTHTRLKGVTLGVGERFELSSPHQVPFHVDGEPVGYLPAVIRAIPDGVLLRYPVPVGAPSGVDAIATVPASQA
ncbi:MAG: diacylglycerol kinase family protein [Nitrospirota bacterium]|nr:diacylglycerol kinase family protein [Nitrospirota bacterium]